MVRSLGGARAARACGPGGLSRSGSFPGAVVALVGPVAGGLLLVVEGELTLELDGEPHRAGPGDAIVFVADRPHTYRNAGGTRLRCAMAVVVQQEPSGDRPDESHHGTGEGA